MTKGCQKIYGLRLQTQQFSYGIDCQQKLATKKTPFEAWYGYKLKLQNFKTFGCLCFSCIPWVKRDKLDKKEKPRIFVGYSSVSRACRIYLPQDNNVIVIRNIQFFESERWSWENNKELELQEEVDIDDATVTKTRSLSDIYQSCNVLISEPTVYEESSANQHWMVVMKEELVMIEKNQTWMLVSRHVICYLMPGLLSLFLLLLSRRRNHFLCCETFVWLRFLSLLQRRDKS